MQTTKIILKSKLYVYIITIIVSYLQEKQGGIPTAAHTHSSKKNKTKKGGHRCHCHQCCSRCCCCWPFICTSPVAHTGLLVWPRSPWPMFMPTSHPPAICHFPLLLLLLPPLAICCSSFTLVLLLALACLFDLVLPGPCSCPPPTHLPFAVCHCCSHCCWCRGCCNHWSLPPTIHHPPSIICVNPPVLGLGLCQYSPAPVVSVSDTLVYMWWSIYLPLKTKITNLNMRYWLVLNIKM